MLKKISSVGVQTGVLGAAIVVGVCVAKVLIIRHIWRESKDAEKRFKNTVLFPPPENNLDG